MYSLKNFMHKFCGSKIGEAVRNFCEEEKFRLLHFIPVLLGTGICTYFCLEREPPPESAIFLTAAVVIAVLCFRKNLALRALLIFCFGFLIAQVRTLSVNTPLLRQPLEDPIKFLATIESCNRTESGLNFIVKNASCPFDSDRIFLSWRGKQAQNSVQNYMPGSRVSIFARLTPLSNQAFPEHYDFKKQQYFNHISARGFIMSPPRKVKSPFAEDSLVLRIEQFRHGINEKIDAVLEADTAAVAKAIITGTKSAIGKNLRENFTKSGTSHVLAISGLHIGIIGLFIFELVRLFLNCLASFSIFFNTKKAAAVISLIGVVFYYFVSGCSVSSLRALLMHALVIAGILLDRRALTMRSVAVAATMILLMSPEVLMFPSFQLSFSAVVSIVAFYEKHWDFSPHLKMLANIIATTIAASLATSVFSVFIFNQVTLNSIFANIFAIPLMTFFVMPAALISMIFLVINVTMPLKILAFGITALINLVKFSAQLPGSLFVMPTPSPLSLSIVIFSSLLFLLIHHGIRFAGLTGIFVGCALYYLEETPRIVVSPHAKVFGIKVDKNLACFNHCGYFKGIMSAWAKSVGCEKRENFHSKSCRKFVQISDDASVQINIDGKHLIFTRDQIRSCTPDTRSVFLDPQNEFTREIYFPSMKETSNSSKNRPWNSVDSIPYAVSDRS